MLGNTINYIKLHDFLDSIGVKRTYMSFHSFYNSLFNNTDQNGHIHWQGRVYTKESVLRLLKEEEGELCRVELQTTHAFEHEVTFQFSSGNEMVTILTNTYQYSQIVEFLHKQGEV